MKHDAMCVPSTEDQGKLVRGGKDESKRNKSQDNALKN